MELREDGMLTDHDLWGGLWSAHACLVLQPRLYLPPSRHAPNLSRLMQSKSPQDWA